MGTAILGILGAIMPVAIKIIMAYLEKSEMDNIVRQRFIDFVESMEKSMKVPSNLRKNYGEQGKRLRERLKKLKEAEKVDKVQ